MKTIDQYTSPQNIDVLLINPGSIHAVYQKLADDFSAVEPPSLAALISEDKV